MRYLTYDEYIDVGGTLEKSDFERIIDRACGIIDWYTQKRLRIVVEISDAVKACIRDVCEYLTVNFNVKGNEIASRSQAAGGVSESETYSAKTSEEKDQGIKGIIYDYLMSETDDGGTPLLYRGAQGVKEPSPVLKKQKVEFEVVYGKNSIEVPIIVYE